MSNKLMFAVPNFPGKDKIVAKGSRALVKVSKHSPEILVGVGIMSGIGATVLACRATLRVGEVIDSHNETLEKINYLKEKAEAGEVIENYTVEEAQKEKFILFVQTAAKVGKLYAPAIIAGMTAIGCVLGGHNILMRRHAALSVAYGALQTAYSEYRQRVRDEVGEEKENDIFKGVKEAVREEVNSKGKTVKKKENTIGMPASPYTRIFDEMSSYWSKNPENNKYFLSLQQKHANDMLRLRGHLFLNEVFDMLDLPRTSMGSVCGWVYGEGDSFVDFGIWDITKQGVREFINAYESSVILDFNCDGVIYDMI